MTDTLARAAPATKADPAKPILALKNVEVIYDHVILVLKGVSLEVGEGGIVAILGANGAGKSTTLKAISNLVRSERGEVTKGTVEFKGERVDGLTPTETVNGRPTAMYEVWLIRPDGSPTAAAFLTPTPDGKHWTAAMNADVSQYAAVATTREAPGNTDYPRGTDVLRISVPTR